MVSPALAGKATRVSNAQNPPGPLRLNIGCGLDVRPGWVNLDCVDYGGNTVADLTRYPWPFPDSHFDEVLASHILEHLPNFNAVINEVWRVCKPGALVVVRVPFFLSTKYYSEPDHRTPFGIRSFDNYEDITGRRLRFYERWKLGHRTNYQSPARFVVEDKRFHVSKSIQSAVQLLSHFINTLFEKRPSRDPCEMNFTRKTFVQRFYRDTRVE